MNEQNETVATVAEPVSIGRVPCPDCGKMLKPSGLHIHRYRMHTDAGLRHGQRIGKLNSRRAGMKRVSPRGKWVMPESMRVERNRIAREKYAARQAALGRVVKVRDTNIHRARRRVEKLQASGVDAVHEMPGQEVEQTQPAPSIAFCPSCGCHLRPYQMAARFANGKH